MMNLVLEKLEELKVDVEYSVRKNRIFVTILDFEGFDDEWEEIYRDYDEDAVGNFLEWLEEQCDELVGYYYQYYQFNDFIVEVGYKSFEV